MRLSHVAPGNTKSYSHIGGYIVDVFKINIDLPSKSWQFHPSATQKGLTYMLTSLVLDGLSSNRQGQKKKRCCVKTQANVGHDRNFLYSDNGANCMTVNICQNTPNASLKVG